MPPAGSTRGKRQNFATAPAGLERDREDGGAVLTGPGDLAAADPLGDEAPAAAQVVDVEHEGAALDRGSPAGSPASVATHIFVLLREIFRNLWQTPLFSGRGPAVLRGAVRRARRVIQQRGGDGP